MDRFVIDAGTMTGGSKNEATRANVPLKNVTVLTVPSPAGDSGS